jgi:hypothetical protein
MENLVNEDKKTMKQLKKIYKEEETRTGIVMRADLRTKQQIIDALEEYKKIPSKK